MCSLKLSYASHTSNSLMSPGEREGKCCNPKYDDLLSLLQNLQLRQTFKVENN